MGDDGYWLHIGNILPGTESLREKLCQAFRREGHHPFQINTLGEFHCKHFANPNFNLNT